MSNHLWQTRKAQQHTKQRLEEQFAVAQDLGFTRVESMRWATAITERRRQQGGFPHQRFHCPGPKVMVPYPYHHVSVHAHGEMVLWYKCTHAYGDGGYCMGHYEDRKPGHSKLATWRSGSSVHASEYTYCRLLGLRTPSVPKGHHLDKYANLDLTLSRLPSSSWSHKVVANIRNIAGKSGLYLTQAALCTANRQHPGIKRAWAAVERGRDLFIKGYGGFNIGAAMDILEPYPESRTRATNIVTVRDVQACGYALKYGLPTIATGRQDARGRGDRDFRSFGDILLANDCTNPSPHLTYLRNHAAWWDQHGHLDLLQHAPTNLLHHPPERLMEILEAQRPAKSKRGPIPTKYKAFDSWPTITEGQYEISPICNQNQLRKAAKDLSNCSNGYAYSLAQGKTALIVASNGNGKFKAMGSIEKGQSKYDQLLGPHNRRLSKRLQAAMLTVLPKYLDLFNNCNN